LGQRKRIKANATTAASITTIAAASFDYSRSVSSIKENFFTASRQQSRFFQCRHLIGHTGLILTMEFSTDGSLIVSGNIDKTVRFWSLCDVPNEKLRSRQLIKRKPLNTIRLLAAWPFHPIAVASSVAASTQRSLFTALARKNLNLLKIFVTLNIISSNQAIQIIS